MTRHSSLLLATVAALLSVAAVVPAQDPAIRLPLDPRISPDGKIVVFAWQNDIWAADVGGRAPARRLTWHPAADRRPIRDRR